MRRCPSPIDLRGPGASPGFTLVEMLVATALFILITLFLAGISNQISHIWTRGENGSQYRQHARAMLDFMGRELSKATLPVSQLNTLYVPAAEPPALQFTINPATLGGTCLNRDAIFWQAPAASDSSAGDLAEVGYFVQWNGAQANLCRFFVNPADTAHYQIYLSQSANTGWLSDALIGAMVKPDKADSYQGLFLQNVVGLWVQAYQADDTPYGATAPATVDSRTPPVAAGGIHPLPCSVEIAVVLLDAASAARLTPQNAAAIKSLYAATTAPNAASASIAADTANAFAKALPAPLPGAAYVSSIKVHLDNYR